MPARSTHPASDNAERILREGWKLFQAKGFHGVSVDELCQRCGLTKPTLYYYFHDKENLYIQVLLRQLRGFREIIEADRPLPDRLESIASAMMDSFNTSLSAMMRDLEHIQSHAHRRALEDAFRDELLGPLAALMEAGVARGELGAEDPAFYAWSFLGLVNAFLARGQRLGVSQAALASRITALFLKGAAST
jgi:AcrR family transcriptional regulator